MARTSTKPQDDSTVESPEPIGGETGVATTPPANATTLDDYNDKPSTTAPGDGPADTTDPTEQATTVGGDKKAAALAGYGTVNAAVPLPKRERGTRASKEKDRTERYDVTAPNGEVVTVERNIETGASKRV